MKKLILPLLIVVCFSNCITYSHLIEAPEYNPSMKLIENNYVFSGTFSYELETKVPAYRSLCEYVKKNFGEKATFGNVVWDIKSTQLFSFKSDKMEYVTFDLYLPKN